jgi:hypothetical protein
MGKACDIAWSKPSGGALKSAGFTVASLYVGQDTTGKNMSLSVVSDYNNNNVGVVTNFEYGAMQMANGAAQGRSDAILGLSQKRACGIPDSRPIYFSADWAATTAQIQGPIIAYLVAARAVLGAGNVGVYGSYYVINAVANYWASNFPGEKVWLWQTIAWSNGNRDTRADMYQDGSTTTVGGVVVDNDILLHTDVGQHPKPVITTKVVDDDMTFIVQFDADPSDPSAGSGIFLLSGGKLMSFANANTALAFKNTLGLQWITVTDGPTLSSFIAASNGQAVAVTVDSTQLASALAADLPTALENSTLENQFGQAVAHAEAVQEHNDTPAS